MRRSWPAASRVAISICNSADSLAGNAPSPLSVLLLLLLLLLLLAPPALPVLMPSAVAVPALRQYTPGWPLAADMLSVALHRRCSASACDRGAPASMTENDVDSAAVAPARAGALAASKSSTAELPAAASMSMWKPRIRADGLAAERLPPAAVAAVAAAAAAMADATVSPCHKPSRATAAATRPMQSREGRPVGTRRSGLRSESLTKGAAAGGAGRGVTLLMWRAMEMHAVRRSWRCRWSARVGVDGKGSSGRNGGVADGGDGECRGCLGDCCCCCACNNIAARRWSSVWGPAVSASNEALW